VIPMPPHRWKGPASSAPPDPENTVSSALARPHGA
jgi:hypothetical protein